MIYYQHCQHLLKHSDINASSVDSDFFTINFTVNTINKNGGVKNYDDFTSISTKKYKPQESSLFLMEK
jgi:hypothetical protein